MENDRIIDMARALARAIQMDDRYVVLNYARKANDEDAELQDAIGRFNLAKMNLNMEVTKEDRDLDKISALNQTVQTTYNEIMENKSMVAYQATKGEMDALMNYVNAILTTAVNGGDPDTVTQPEACSGSCESCGGCH